MSQPVTVIAQIRSKKGKESQLQQGLQRLLAPTRAESGCINYDLHQSQTDPTLFVFYENWESQAALDAHLQSEHLKTVRAQLTDIVEGPSDITRWTKVK